MPLADEIDGSFAGEALGADVGLVGVLAVDGAAADRHRGAEGLGDELLPREAVVAERAADVEGAGADRATQLFAGGMELEGGDVLGRDGEAGLLREGAEGEPVGGGDVVEGEGDGDEVAAADDDESLAVGAEQGLAPAGAERLEGLREVARERLLEGNHPRAPAAAGVADADDLVVGHAAEGALVGLERAEAQVEPHLQGLGRGREGGAVAGAGEGAADDGGDLLLGDGAVGAGPGGDASVDEDDAAVEGDLDADEGLGVARGGDGDDAVGDGVGEAVGVAGADGFGEAERVGANDGRHADLRAGASVGARCGRVTRREARGARSRVQPSGVRTTRRSTRAWRTRPARARPGWPT